MILSICDNIDVLRIIRIIKSAVLIIKIVVPIILILFCMFEAIKTISSHDADITKELLNSWKTKMIAAALVFFIPTFVNMLANIGNADTNEIKKCFINSTSENIDILTIELAEKQLELTRASLSTSDYTVTYRTIRKVHDKEAQARLFDKLKVLEGYIELKNRIFELVKKCDSKKFRALKEEIEALDDQEIKDKLLQILDDNVKCKDLGWWWPVGSTETTTSGGVTYAEGPPATTRITAYFSGDDPVHQGSHDAIDIGSSHDPIIASKSGTVIYPGPNDRIDYPDSHIKSIAEDCPGLKANYVVIQHEDGFTTQYGHLYKNTITVRKGDHVDQGQVIGLSGSSGCSTGDHLHFQMELNGTRVDPLLYVSTSNPRP